MQISNAEWRIMKIIWMEGKQTSTDLIAVLSERFDWSKSTIKTLLTRLVEKGCLTREKSGKVSTVISGLKVKEAVRRVEIFYSCATAFLCIIIGETIPLAM